MTLTPTNLSVLRSLFGVARRIANRLDQVDVPHVRRLVALGLVAIDGRYLVLTDAGRREVTP